MSTRPIQKIPTKIKFVYKKPDELQPAYINGAIGGLSPKGELIMDFYFEHVDLPMEQRMPLVDGKPQLDQESRLERIKHDPDELVMVRNIRATLIIPVQEISNIANWMLDKLKASNIVLEKGE